MATAEGDLVLQTLQLLEWRLRRLEYMLSGTPGEPSAGSSEAGQQQRGSVAKRLGRIEDGIAKLSERHSVVRELDALKSRQPRLFEPPSSSDNTDTTTPSTPDTPTKLSLVLTSAPAFPAAASQLTQLRDLLPLPPTQSYTSLIALAPRLAAADSKQRAQAVELAELRRRSGAVLLRWHGLYVLGQGRCWAEWDGRMERAERRVRREEVRREDGGV